MQLGSEAGDGALLVQLSLLAFWASNGWVSALTTGNGADMPELAYLECAVSSVEEATYGTVRTLLKLGGFCRDECR